MFVRLIVLACMLLWQEPAYDFVANNGTSDCEQTGQALSENSETTNQASAENSESTVQETSGDAEHTVQAMASDYDVNHAYEEIYDLLQIDEMQSELSKHGLTGTYNFKDLIKAVQNDNSKGVFYSLISMIQSYLFQNINTFKTLMIEVLSVVLLGSIFIHLSNSFGNGFVSENGFYVAYLIITSILLTAFSVSMETARQTLQQLIILIQIFVPVYALAMQYLGRPLTAMGMYELITIGIFVVQIIILKFVLPMIRFYVVTAMINNLNKEDMFSKLCKFVQFIIRWILKTVIVVVAGLNVIKSLLEPQMDELSKHAISKLIASVPGGGIVSVLTGTFLGAGAIIKNSIGIAGILLIVGLLLIPLLQMFLMMVFAKITAVMIQPIGEKRFVEGVETLADGMKLLLQSIASSTVLFILTIAIMAFASRGGT